MRGSVWVLIACLAAVPGLAAPVQAADSGQRLIIRFTAGAIPKSLAPRAREAAQAGRLAGLARAADRSLTLTRLRESTGGALVVALPAAIDETQAAALAAQFAAQADVDWAVPDRRVKHFGTPDPFFGAQWNLQGPDGAAAAAGGASVVPAWAWTQGAGSVVAVIDSGYTEHPDLAGAWLPGYDMIAGDSRAGFAMAGDGDGRDPDARDPGNWCDSDGGAVRDSSWHGTVVAGIIAARHQNGYGIAGVAPQAAVLPVRALGHCGGYMSDVLDALRWAAGIAVEGLPSNPYPARILNASLGSSGGIPCSAYEQAAVDELTAAGALLVVAAGNEGGRELSSPASCRGALAVAAHDRAGQLAGYTNIDARVALTAPGGTGTTAATAILGSGNSGSTVPDSPLPARAIAGTSAAAPHVSAAAALLLTIDPSLSVDTLRNALLSSARPWPAGSRCSPVGDAAGLCGAGMLDVARALAWIDGPLGVAVAAPRAAVAGGSQVSLSARTSSTRFGPGELRFHWTQRSGDPVTLAGADQAAVVVTVPARRTRVGLRVTVTDPSGREAIADTVIEVNNSPVIHAVAPPVLAPGDRLELRIDALDPDGDALDFWLLEGPAGMVIGRDDGLLVWPAASAGRHPVRVRVADVFGLAAADLDFEVVVGDDAMVSGGLLSPFGSDRGGGGALSPGLLVVLAAAFVILRRKPGATRRFLRRSR